MEKKSVKVYVFAVLSLFLGAYLIYNTEGLQYKFRLDFMKYGNKSDSKPSATFSNIFLNRRVQKDRIIQVHRTCEKYKQLKSSPGYRKHKSVFYAAPRYNWSYCKIGKIGSTLWTQFFYILHHEGDEIKNALTKCREDIHNMENFDHLRMGVKKSMFRSTRMIVSARNPYTRLFSAYIDRIYIPSTSISVRGKTDHKCKSDITFSEFLQYVTQNTRKGQYDYHWSPVFYLCKPCETDPQVVFKQETFQTDLFYVVNQTHLEPYKLDVLSKVMQTEGNWSGFALVDDVMDYITPTNQRHARDCQTWEQVVRRVWEALKIQGFISVKAPFPSSLYTNLADFNNSNVFREALMDARTNYPLSKTGSSLQRIAAFNRFYEEVDPAIIEEIQDVYSVDFEMFGYSDTPPPW